MSSRRLFAALLAMVATVALPAMAGTIVTSTCGSCGFQTWSAAVLNENGNPYFDTPSVDGSRENIGYWLTDTGGIDPGDDTLSPGQAINYYGTASGDPALNYYFSVTPAGAGFNGQIKVEIAGFSGVNKFGWYEPGDPNSKTQVFGGSAGQGDPFAFTLPLGQSTFGFYVETGNGRTYYTESSLNPSGHQFQHFALFSNDQETYWIGVEDNKLTSETVINFFKGTKRIGDFNDMVVNFSQAPGAEAPEPGTWAMLGGGLVALGLLRFRRRAN